MSNVSAILLDTGAASRRRPLTIGDTVRVKSGTPDPDFPRMRLDDWVGEVVEAAANPTRCLVKWKEQTICGMAPEYRSWCDREDMVVDQMWLLEDDLDSLST